MLYYGEFQKYYKKIDIDNKLIEKKQKLILQNILAKQLTFLEYKNFYDDFDFYGNNFMKWENILLYLNKVTYDLTMQCLFEHSMKIEFEERLKKFIYNISKYIKN